MVERLKITARVTEETHKALSSIEGCSPSGAAEDILATWSRVGAPWRATTGDGMAWGHLLETHVRMLQRVWAGLREDKAFSDEELGLILEVGNGLSLIAGLTGQHLLIEVHDACRLNGAHRQWGVDPKALIGRLEELDPLQRHAIEVWAAEWWARSGDEADSWFRLVGRDRPLPATAPPDPPAAS